MQYRPRTPYQTQILENVERIMDHSYFSKEQYLISQTNDKGELYFDSILSTADFLKLRANFRDLKIALTSSVWLSQYTTINPKPYIRLPFQIDKKVLIIYDVPNVIGLPDIIQFVQSITQNNEFKAFPHKLGYSVTFNSAEQCMAFWRTLNICRLKGYLLKGMISIQKVQNKPSMGRSHSMTFQQRKKKNPRKQEKLPQLQIIYSMKDNDFPPLN